MMINTTTQLNDFAKKAGVKTREQILPELIKHKELITPQLAKLIAPEQFKIAG